MKQHDKDEVIRMLNDDKPGAAVWHLVTIVMVNDPQYDVLDFTDRLMDATTEIVLEPKAQTTDA